MQKIEIEKDCAECGSVHYEMIALEENKVFSLEFSYCSNCKDTKPFNTLSLELKRVERSHKTNKRKNTMRLDKEEIENIREAWINGNKTRSVISYLELNELERAYFVYYLDPETMAPSFLRLLESILEETNN